MFQHNVRRPNTTRQSTGGAHHLDDGRLATFRSQRISVDRVPWVRALSTASVVVGGNMGTRGRLSCRPAWIEASSSSSAIQGGGGGGGEGGGAELLEGSCWRRDDDKGRLSCTYLTMPRWINQSYHDLQTLFGILKSADKMLERSKAAAIAAHPGLDLSHVGLYYSMDGLPNSTLQGTVAKHLSKIRRGKVDEDDDDNALDPEFEWDECETLDISGAVGQFTQLPAERLILATAECGTLGGDAEGEAQTVPEEGGGGGAGEEDDEDAGERELDPMTDPALVSPLPPPLSMKRLVRLPSSITLCNPILPLACL